MIHFKFVGIKDMHNIYYLGLSGERSLPFRLLVYPILFILAGNDDMHESLEDFEIRRDQTTDCRVSCP